MLRDGQKWACDSCIRGHRVSNCNHHERELKMIAPKGRPVKQCEHCRSARKDKSHHAKCDCGSKKPKDVLESEPKMESIDCCCHKGVECVCGIQSEMADRRQETILRRRTMPVKSKPCLSSSNSDQSLPGLNGPKHKPVHNTHGQALMAPYPKPSRSTRPNSIHNPPYACSFADSSEGDVSRSVDDVSLISTSSKTYGANYAAQLSAESTQNYNDLDYNTFLFGGEDGSGSVLSRTTSAEALSVTTGWFDSSSLSTVTEIPDFLASPNHLYFDTGTDWNIPSATTDFFSPSDLPLVSQASDSIHTVSQSGESNYQSAPPLTASSSGAQSEIGEPLDSGRADGFPNFWSGTVGIRESYPLASIDYGFPQSLPTYDSGSKQKHKSIRHRQTYSSGSTSHCHSHHLSDQTTVPDNVSSLAGVNIGHLQNLAYSDHSANQSASPEYPPTGSEFGAISIPASIDDPSYRDDWYLGADAAVEASSKDYSWLLDSA